MEKAKLASVQVRCSLPKGYQYAAIPWGVHEKVYQKYASIYGTCQSMERISQRGGFGVKEIRELYPEWDNTILIAKQDSDNIRDWKVFELT